MNYIIDRKEINPWIFPGIKPNILFKSSDQIMQEISLVVCTFFNISLDQIRGKRQSRYLSDARGIAMYFCYNSNRLSLSYIGRYFGGRDHSTVIHAIQTLKDRMRLYPTEKSTVEKVEQLLSKV